MTQPTPAQIIHDQAQKAFLTLTTYIRDTTDSYSPNAVLLADSLWDTMKHCCYYSRTPTPEQVAALKNRTLVLLDVRPSRRAAVVARDVAELLLLMGTQMAEEDAPVAYSARATILARTHAPNKESPR